MCLTTSRFQTPSKKPGRRRPTPRTTRLYFVRHGEVHNPEHVVYGLLPGWHLSEKGLDEACKAGESLADASLDAIYSSPLERAVTTAEVISRATGAPVSIDHRLIEWRLGEHWGGSTWESVRKERSREFETYMRSPDQIDFIDEKLAALADRMAEAASEHAASHPGGVIAIVSHSDPIKAAVLRMTGRDLSQLHRLHIPTGGIVTLEVHPDGATLVRPGRHVWRKAPAEGR